MRRGAALFRGEQANGASQIGERAGRSGATSSIIEHQDLELAIIVRKILT
jgi:hypothetical protein